MVLVSNYRAGHCTCCETERADDDLRMVVDVREPGDRPVPLCLKHLAEAIKAACKGERKEDGR